MVCVSKGTAKRGNAVDDLTGELPNDPQDKLSAEFF